MSQVMNDRPELLAPAGDRERLEMALLYGADAVYLGGKSFGMRATPQNFDEDGLEQAVRMSHAKGRKVYLTCNTVPTNEEVDGLPAFIGRAAEIGVDALIVADIGVLALARKLAPSMPLHISTQAGVVNYLAAREFYKLGASRVVLARELSLDQIRKIRDNIPVELELEAFVHGAMCMSVSGRCLLSHYMTGRDANRGECAQPCRWAYYLVEEKRPGQYYPLFEEEGASYILNAEDLSMIGHLDRMLEAGVTGLKIEGRAKSAYYVAAVTNAYRMALDLYLENPKRYLLPKWLEEEVGKVSYRRMSTGFYLGDVPVQYTDTGGYVRDWEVVAVAEGWKDGRLFCRSKNRFSEGETLEIMIPGRRPEPFVVEEMMDEETNALETARHPHMKVSLKCGNSYPTGSILRREKKVL